MSAKTAKSNRSLSMEGVIATWYARNAAKDAEYRRAALRIISALDPGAKVLDVGTGPGHLAIELAKLQRTLGAFAPGQVIGLDISRSFIRIAAENARKAIVDVEFKLGDAAALPFADETFDAVLCRAAFKNFGKPVEALNEMHRVLRPGGFALIMDLNRETPAREIDDYLDQMQIGPVNRLIVRFIFMHLLMKRAYAPPDFATMAWDSRFGTCDIRPAGIGLDIWLVKPGVTRENAKMREFSPLLFV